MDIQRLAKLAGILLTEGKTEVPKLKKVEMMEYSSSGEFDEAFDTLGAALDYSLKILESEAFINWMKHSESNYDFKMKHYEATVKAGREYYKSLDKLYEELSKLR